jgi:hypothetical protein
MSESWLTAGGSWSTSLCSTLARHRAGPLSVHSHQSLSWPKQSAVRPTEHFGWTCRCVDTSPTPPAHFPSLCVHQFGFVLRLWGISVVICWNVVYCPRRMALSCGWRLTLLPPPPRTLPFCVAVLGLDQSWWMGTRVRRSGAQHKGVPKSPA